MPKIKEPDLKAHIKNKSFSRVYLIYGEEQMYVKSYTKKLIDAVTDKAPSEFNFHRFSGEIDLWELDASTQIVSFFGGYNCVLAEDIFFDAWKSDEPKDYFIDIISRVPDGVVLIISMPSYVPKSGAKYFEKLVKLVEKKGSVCNFPRLDQNTLEKHISKWAQQNGRLISRVAASQLIAECGNDLNRLKNEVDKVCAHAKGEEVTPEDIAAVATLTVETTVFKLSDAVVQNRPDAAYSILDNLRSGKEDPFAILAVISDGYIDAYRARVAAESGVKNDQLSKDFEYGRRAFVPDKMAKMTRKLSTAGLRKSVALLTDAEFRLKSTKVNEWLVLEQIIAQLLLIAREERA